MDDLKCINVKDLAKLTGLGQKSIRQAISDKSNSRKLKLPRITRLGSCVRFRMDHVREWLDERAGVALPVSSSMQPVVLAAAASPLTDSPRRPGAPRKVARAGGAV